MKNKIHELYALEQLSGGNTWVHRLHPTAKLLATVLFIVTVVSFNRYSFLRLVPFIFYPAILMAFSEVPHIILFKRFLIALPFCLFAGIANVIFERSYAFAIGTVPVSYGVLSLLTILLRVYLCVIAVLLLVAVTPLSDIVQSMGFLKLPFIFIVVFEVTYRYIGVLLEEAYSMYIAYTLRNFKKGGVKIRDMGSFAGQLLFRSMDRSDRIYNAMKCRGYTMQNLPQKTRKFGVRDILFFTVTVSFCLFFRFKDINSLFYGIRGFP